MGRNYAGLGVAIKAANGAEIVLVTALMSATFAGPCFEPLTTYGTNL
jgi:hypothetical protein